MPAEVDGAGGHMDVHEVIHDTALDVVSHTVHHIALSHVHDFDVGQIPFQREGRERPLSVTRALGGPSRQPQELAAERCLPDHQASYHNTQDHQLVCKCRG